MSVAVFRELPRKFVQEFLGTPPKVREAFLQEFSENAFSSSPEMPLAVLREYI